MAAIAKLRVSFANIATRVVNTGASFAFVVAYLLFALMFLFLITDLILTIVRSW